MTTNQYVFINSHACSVINGGYDIDLGFDSNRPPLLTIEVISANVETTTEYSLLNLRCDLAASNSYQNDQYPACLGTIVYAGQNSLTTTETYMMTSTEQPKLVISNIRKFTIQFILPTGAKVLIDDIISFTLMFKLTYPKPLDISTEYRSQIPL
tara:strand:- start:929 stop:1390 length:462 start_codon:yes stop_codon:yes gene_type:complete